MIARFAAALVVVLAVIAPTPPAGAEEPAAKPRIVPSVEAICGEYANALHAQRARDEIDLATARAHVKALEKALAEARKEAKPQ